MTTQEIKQRYGIIGSSTSLNIAIDTARQVAPTDITVLITGESGVGKEVFPQIIHQLSSRKHGPYIAVNCGAIPEGTIDSELFGHEKGSFTGAHEARKGYFEVANGGTIFLDEVAELPLSTQVRLLRVLETGEFFKVGSSKALKTDVRVVAATNVNMAETIAKNKFREDLYYRLNTVPIHVPPLRNRKEDIYLLLRKFAADFADRYRMPAISLDSDARTMLEEYRWPGNIRQLKNITEQVSILESKKEISGKVLLNYIPSENGNQLPVLFKEQGSSSGEFSERDILYKVLFDMKKDLNDLRKLVMGIIQTEGNTNQLQEEQAGLIRKLYQSADREIPKTEGHVSILDREKFESAASDIEDYEEESLSLEVKEVELIRKALEKHKGKRKYAARELGISERTLYRKIKEYELT